MKIIITLLSIMFTFSVQADEIYQESAVEICQHLKQKSYSKKCMAQVKQVKYNETALSYCGKQTSWNKIKGCLEVIKDAQYQEQSLAICHTAKYFSNEYKKCMAEIAEKSYISTIEIGLCNDEKSYKKKIKCLKAASSNPYEEVAQAADNNEQIVLANLKVEIKKAYELLRNNKTADATILLHDLVNSLEK
jgi:hypothetical protein